jgi:hypothetical protein
MRLHADDPDDPWVFRVDFPEYGKSSRVVFVPGREGDGTTTRLLLDVLSLRKRPDVRNPRLMLTGGLAVGAGALAARRLHDHPSSVCRS